MNRDDLDLTVIRRGLKMAEQLCATSVAGEQFDEELDKIDAIQEEEAQNG